MSFITFRLKDESHGNENPLRCDLFFRVKLKSEYYKKTDLGSRKVLKLWVVVSLQLHHCLQALVGQLGEPVLTQISEQENNTFLTQIYEKNTFLSLVELSYSSG